MSIENEISSLTTAIRNLTDVLLASAAKSLPAAPATVTVGAVATAVGEPVPSSLPAPAPEPKKTVKKEPAPVQPLVVDPAVVTNTPENIAARSEIAKEAVAPTVSEDDQRVQIVELARPNMADAAFKAFLGGKLAELQGAACSISGTGKLPKIDAKHLPTLLAAINKQLGK